MCARIIVATKAITKLVASEEDPSPILGMNLYCFKERNVKSQSKKTNSIVTEKEYSRANKITKRGFILVNSAFARMIYLLSNNNSCHASPKYSHFFWSTTSCTYFVSFARGAPSGRSNAPLNETKNPAIITKHKIQETNFFIYTQAKRSLKSF